MSDKIKVGLALSGGGARGMAHTGVLQALNDIGIFPHRISGSSAGALVGALYCAGMEPDEILELSKQRSFAKVFHLGFASLGLTDHRYLVDLLNDQLGDIRFKDLKIPLSVGVTNIDSGRFEVLESGDLIPAVVASCSIPLLFNPVKINGQSYLDGGLMNNLPVEPLLQTCDKVIGISVHQHTYNHRVEGLREIGIRSFQLAIWNTMEERMKKCDIALDVTAAGEIGMFELDRAIELFKIGVEAVEERNAEFEELLLGKWSLKKIFR